MNLSIAEAIKDMAQNFGYPLPVACYRGQKYLLLMWYTSALKVLSF